MESNEISTAKVVALAKALAIKYGSIGIANISENENVNVSDDRKTEFANWRE